jgi:hypothetical protein
LRNWSSSCLDIAACMSRKESGRSWNLFSAGRAWFMRGRLGCLLHFYRGEVVDYSRCCGRCWRGLIYALSCGPSWRTGNLFFWVSWSYGEDEDEDEDWSCWGLGWGSSRDEYPDSTRQIFMNSTAKRKGQKSRSYLKRKSSGFLRYENWKYCIHPIYLPHSKLSKKKNDLDIKFAPPCSMPLGAWPPTTEFISLEGTSWVGRPAEATATWRLCIWKRQRKGAAVVVQQRNGVAVGRSMGGLGDVVI